MGIDFLGCLAIKDKDVWPVLRSIYEQNPASNAISELAAVEAPQSQPFGRSAATHDGPPTRRRNAMNRPTLKNPSQILVSTAGNKSSRQYLAMLNTCTR
jgi:hypothetical protein